MILAIYVSLSDFVQCFLMCCVCTEAAESDLDTAQISGNTRPKGFYFSLCVVITKKIKTVLSGSPRSLYIVLNPSFYLILHSFH